MNPPDYSDDQQAMTADQKKSHARTKWSSGLESKLALIASIMTPYECFTVPAYLYFRGGGVVFLPLYVFFVAVLAVPLMLLEVGVGQFTGKGVWSAWNIAPLFKGIGYLMTIMNSNVALTYFWFMVANILFCADLAMSPPEELSIISHCPNGTMDDVLDSDGDDYNYSYSYGTSPDDCVPSGLFRSRWIAPYYYRSTPNSVHPSESLTIDPAALLVMVLLVLLVCGIVAAGRRAIGLLSAVCALLTPLLLLMLMIRVLTLPGAVHHGLHMGFSPMGFYYDASLLVEAIIDAAMLALFTVGASSGQTLTAASYNRFNNCFLIDVLLATGVQIFTVLVSCVFYWGASGVLAEQGYKDMFVGADVEAISKLTEALLLHCPSGGFWTGCFLVCILLRGLVASVWVVETVVIAVWDLLPHTDRFRLLVKKHVLVAVFAVPWLFLSIGFCTKGAWSTVTKTQLWSTGRCSISFLCFLECAAVAWLFGARRFQSCWSAMQGSRCGCPYPMVFWAIIAPILLLVLLICYLVQESMRQGYPDIASFIFAVLLMVISALVLLFTRPGTIRQKWKIMTTPWDLAPHQMQNSHGRYETIPMSTTAN